MTPRERQVLAGLARGLTIREIAWDLFVSPKTVENHCASIKEKAGLANMHQLIVYAVRAMKPLQWSQMKSGTWNGKVGVATLMVVAWQPGRGWFVAPKLPGLKTVNVGSEQEGRKVAGKLWAGWGREMGI